ncbi:hypothetical protein VKT23_010170 [Stygiomarasmius scandens]|uniref:CCHC-type domain-containing protein n=1 Tax=Marasmiellus scandens TaxID=2682957 RepID=A0ABR1JEX0_9AGAR
MNTPTTKNTIVIPTLTLSPPHTLKTDTTVTLTPKEPLPIPPPTSQNLETTQNSNDIHDSDLSETDDPTTQELIDSIHSLLNAIKELDDKIKFTIEAIDKVAEINQQRTRDENIHCQKCSQKGHMAKNCEKFVCRYCDWRKPGHYPSECSWNPKNSWGPTSWKDAKREEEDNFHNDFKRWQQ